MLLSDLLGSLGAGIVGLARELVERLPYFLRVRDAEQEVSLPVSGSGNQAELTPCAASLSSMIPLIPS